jgi:hypothetical protein
MESICAISESEMLEYGCPHCGSVKVDTFLTMNSFGVCYCDTCGKEFVTANSVEELQEVPIRNTDITNLIGRHPITTKHRVLS